MALLTVDGLVAGYSAADEVLKGVSFAIDAGEIVGVIGPNGAGKSTLFKTVAGLLKPGKGEIRLEGRPIGGRPPRDVARLGIAYVPQEQNVFPTMSVRENLEMGGYVDPGGSKRRIEVVFERFPVLAQKRRHAARTLSGGERQMLAMAMGLMVEPKLLLLDEPSAGLSPAYQDEVFINCRRINESGVSIVMVEQNAYRCLQICHRGYVLDQGRNAYADTGDALLNDPKVVELYLGTLARTR
jgi:branched-chain amino acid transport system ATP-binding protein